MELGLCEDLLAAIAQEAANMKLDSTLEHHSILGHPFVALVAMSIGYDARSSLGRNHILLSQNVVLWETNGFSNCAGPLSSMSKQR